VFTRLNLAKINQEWRSILRQLKCKELKDEVEALKQVCVDAIEHKNSIIKRLLGDLDESEELFSTLLNTHIESVAQLVEIHAERLDFLQEWFAKEKSTILDRCSQEIRNYKAKKFQAQKEIECVYYGMANEANQREKTLELEHMQKREDLKNKVLLAKGY
jgi:Sperm tail